jgi:hypothetical protein
MAPVNEHGQLNPFRTAKIHHFVHRGPDRPSREKNVVHENHMGSPKGYR